MVLDPMHKDVVDVAVGIDARCSRLVAGATSMKTGYRSRQHSGPYSVVVEVVAAVVVAVVVSAFVDVVDEAIGAPRVVA